MVEQGKPLPHHVQKEFDVIGYNLKVAAESLLPGCDVSDQMDDKYLSNWLVYMGFRLYSVYTMSDIRLVGYLFRL